MSKVRVKVCGLSRSEDVALAEELGAWALGFIFYEKSPRYVTPEQVKKILSTPRKIVSVGVFVNASIDSVCEIVNHSLVTGVQLHGDETAEYCRELKARLPAHLIIKAFQPRDAVVLSKIESYSSCEHILFDHYSESARGGTGKTADWDLAEQAGKQCSLILSGGLSAENVRAAIKKVAPFALDVSSLLESSPGIKSEKKMRDFFAAVNL